MAKNIKAAVLKRVLLTANQRAKLARERARQKRIEIAERREQCMERFFGDGAPESADARARG